MSVHRPNLPQTIWCLQPPFDDLNFWTRCTITTRNNYKPKCQTTSQTRNNTTRNSRERIQVHLQWSITGQKIITWHHPKSSSTLQKRRKNLCWLPCPQSPHQTRRRHLVVCVPSAPPPYYKPRSRLCWWNQVSRRKNLLSKTIPKCGKTPSTRQQKATPRKSNNVRSTGATMSTKEKRPKTLGGIIGLKQQNTGNQKLKGSNKESKQMKEKKKEKNKQEITNNSGTNLEEDPQKEMETVTGENQLKKEQDLDQTFLQKDTHQINQQNIIPPHIPHSNFPVHQEAHPLNCNTNNNFGTTNTPHIIPVQMDRQEVVGQQLLLPNPQHVLEVNQDNNSTCSTNQLEENQFLGPNQPDGILKQVQKTQVKTPHNRKRQRQTTQQKNVKKPKISIKSQLEEIKQAREKYKATKDQLDKATLSALVQSVSKRVISWRQKEIPNGAPEKLKVITPQTKKIETLSIRKIIKLSDRPGRTEMNVHTVSNEVNSHLGGGGLILQRMYCIKRSQQPLGGGGLILKWINSFHSSINLNMWLL